MVSSILQGDPVSTSGSVLLILAKATLILLAALAVSRAMERGSAVARHLVWFVSLAALLAIPALASWSPLRLAILPASTSFDAAPSVAPTGFGPRGANAPADAPVVAAPRAPAPHSDVEATVNTVRDIVSPRTPWFGILSDPGLLLAIWATVALVFAGWLVAGAISVSRIIHRARTLNTPDWLNPLWEVADRLGLEDAPRLVRSTDAKMPFACGLIRPAIVLPAESDSWTLDRRRAVLLHELAHIRRRDLIGHTIGRLACAIYWFHPLVWTAARRLRAESERACDDLALTCGARASDYAEHLLDIVTGVRHHATPAVALAMARRKEFEGRMLAILDPELHRTAPSRARSAGMVGALAALSLLVGAAAPVARSSSEAGAAGGRPFAATISGSDSAVTADRVIAQQVPAVEARRAELSRREIQARSDSIRHRLLDPAIRSGVERAVGQDVGRAVGEMVGGVVEDVVTASVESSRSSAQELAQRFAAMIKAPPATQGRADDRPALLANVLRTDTSATLRRVAAWGLSQYAGESDVAVAALTMAVTRDSDAAVREMAAWALADARSGARTVIDALSSAMRRDASTKVRATAAWALGNVGDRDATDALVAGLADTSRAVRLRAAWALGNVEPKEAPPAVLQLLSDSDVEVRRMAAWVLYNVQDPDAVPALQAALQREADKDAQRAFIRALAATGEKSVDAIKALIDSKDPEVRGMAIRALAGGSALGAWPWPWPNPRPQP